MGFNNDHFSEQKDLALSQAMNAVVASLDEDGARDVAQALFDYREKLIGLQKTSLSVRKSYDYGIRAKTMAILGEFLQDSRERAERGE